MTEYMTSCETVLSKMVCEITAVVVWEYVAEGYGVMILGE